jgi:flagellar basal body-associated protein FliL
MVMQDDTQDNIKGNKKKLIYIIIAIILLVVIAIGTVLVLNANNKTPDASRAVDADTLKSQALDARKNKDEDKAKELLEQANDKYKAEGDTNNVADTNTLLCLSGEKAYCPPATE